MIRLHLLRHAPAGSRDPARWPDDAERPVSQAGRRKMQKGARGMARLGIHPRVVLTSPLARARQTARLLVMELGELGELAPGTAVTQVEWLRPEARQEEAIRSLRGEGEGCLVLVGHEPHLSRLAARLISPAPEGVHLSLKKGGLCRIDFDGPVRPGAGRLIFLLPPRLLRGLGSRQI